MGLCSHPCFPDGETEAQRSQVAWIESQAFWNPHATCECSSLDTAGGRAKRWGHRGKGCTTPSPDSSAGVTQCCAHVASGFLGSSSLGEGDICFYGNHVVALSD
jgi:hypothetical protein